ncbi:MAG: SseB family protein [Pseudomonadota bacterium]
MTPLDAAVAALSETPEDESRTRVLYATLAASELCLLLQAEAKAGQVVPLLFPAGDGQVALVFDREERLVDFASSAPFVALSGRSLVNMLADRGIGLGLNLGTSQEYLFPDSAVDWLAQMQVIPKVMMGKPSRLAAPRGWTDALLPQIEARFAATQGLAQSAVLAEAEYSGSDARPFIAFIGANEEAEPVLVQLIGEVLAIIGTDPASVDLAFLPAGGVAAERAMAAGLTVDLPRPPQPKLPEAPGKDPARPPKLR